MMSEENEENDRENIKAKQTTLIVLRKSKNKFTLEKLT